MNHCIIQDSFCVFFFQLPIIIEEKRTVALTEHQINLDFNYNNRTTGAIE